VEDARMSLKVLSGRIGLTSPSTAERLKRLEERGVIQGYGAGESGGAGYTLQALVRVRPLPGLLHKVDKYIQAMPECIESDKVTGEIVLLSGWWCGRLSSLIHCWMAWRSMPSAIRRL
jgi:Lrp/AsnC family leucine-responsive transcriptional regulator